MAPFAETTESRSMKKNVFLFLCFTAVACTEYINETPAPPAGPVTELSLSDLARTISELPIRQDQMNEVYQAVCASSANGYDEEYMMSDLINSPGRGVGAKSDGTKAVRYQTPLRDLLVDHLSQKYSDTKAGAAEVESYINSLLESGAQIYWPYSEDWDGRTLPVVTFDPGYGAESNYGYEITLDNSGARVVDSVYVDENLAKVRPVWVINKNEDSAFTPLDFYEQETKAASAKEPVRQLTLKNFTMLRNYDSWFAGASEFFIKCGSASGFKASTDEELKKYYPSITDFMIVVKRKDVGVTIPFDCMLVSDFTSQIDKIALMITEDDGGTTTDWKCSASVKYNSKAYGFDLNLPYKDKDDIVWRGQLASSFFNDEEVEARLGDVIVTFNLK